LEIRRADDSPRDESDEIVIEYLGAIIKVPEKFNKGDLKKVIEVVKSL
jgi:hypothetical protein